MALFSDRLRLAFLSALSTTLAFALAFAFALEKPFWAGFAALVVSLATLGQSLQKGMLRMAGTFVGALAAMTVLSVFGDAPGALFAAVGALLFLLVLFMLASRRNSYFYYTTALVAMLVVAQSHAEAPFRIAVARVEENLLGIAVYTACSLLLSPGSSLEALKRSALELAAWPARLSQAAEDGSFAEQYRQAGEAVNNTEALLSAARLESYEVRRDPETWEALIRLCSEGIRMQQERFLGRQEQGNGEEAAGASAGGLEHFALWNPAVECSRPAGETGPEGGMPLRDGLEEVLRTLFCGEGRGGKALPAEQEEAAFLLTADRLGQAFRALAMFALFTAVWLLFDPPGGGGTLFVEICVMLGLVGFLSGRFEPWKLVLSFAAGTALSLVLYLAVLPRITGFAELGGVLFLMSFAASWLFCLPSQGMMRTGVLLPAFVLTGAGGSVPGPSAWLEGAAALMSCGLCTALFFYLLQGPPPERAFASAWRRFERVAARLEQGKGGGLRRLWDRMRLYGLARELARLSFLIREESLGLEPQALKLLALSCRRAAIRIDRASGPAPGALEPCRAVARRIFWDRMEVQKF